MPMVFQNPFYGPNGQLYANKETFDAAQKPPPATTASGIPATPASWGGGAGQDMANINYILNPFFDTTETRTNAAEANLGAGTSGSAFGAGTTNRLLESEKLARFKLGHELLEPYNQRSFQAGENAADRAARLNEIAAQGAQAMQQLQLQEAGQTARASAAERAALERAVLAGNQAMAQLKLQEAGQTSRSNAAIAGNLANTRLGILGDIVRAQIPKAGTATGALPPLYHSEFDAATGMTRAVPDSTIPGQPGNARLGIGASGGNAIDAILRRYNLI